MEKVKRKIEVTQDEYDDICEALRKYARMATSLGYQHVSVHYKSLARSIEDQIDEQGGFEE